MIKEFTILEVIKQMLEARNALQLKFDKVQLTICGTRAQLAYLINKNMQILLMI